MEEIGEHCGFPGCHHLDFLPFFCAACNTFYCLDHRTPAGHRCEGGVATEGAPQVPSTAACKRCRRLFAVPANIGPEEFLSLHRQSDACAGVARRRPRCALQSCGAQPMKLCLVECRDCSKLFCLQHRFPPDHNCSHRAALDAAAAEKAAASATLVSSAREHVRAGAAWTEAGCVADRKAELPSNSRNPGSQARAVADGGHVPSNTGSRFVKEKTMTYKALKTMRKIEAIRIKMKLKPDLSIPETHRLAVRVDLSMVPHSMLPVKLSSTKHKSEGILMHVDGSKTAGWNLDRICAHLAIRNANAEVGASATFWVLGTSEAGGQAKSGGEAVIIRKMDPAMLLEETVEDGSVLFLMWDDPSAQALQ